MPTYIYEYSANDTFPFYSDREYGIEKSAVCRIIIDDFDRDTNSTTEGFRPSGTGVLITDNINSNYYILTAAHVVILDHLDFESPIRYEERYWGNTPEHRYHLNFNYIQDNSSTDSASNCLSFADVKGELVYVNTYADIALIKITDNRIINDPDISAASFWDYWDYESSNDYIALHHFASFPMKISSFSGIKFKDLVNNLHLIETTNLDLSPQGRLQGMPYVYGSSGSPLINKKNHAVVSVVSSVTADEEGGPTTPYRYVNTQLYGNDATNEFETTLSQILKINSRSSRFKGLPYWATPAVVKKNMTLSHFDNEVSNLNVFVKNNSQLEIKTNKISKSNFYYDNGCLVRMIPVNNQPTTINPGTIIGPALPQDSDRISSDNATLHDISTTTKYIKRNSLNIFPNPVSDVLHINWIEDLNVEKVILTDIYTNKVREQLITSKNTNSRTLNVQNLNKGIYILRVFNKKGDLIKTNKIVITD